MPDVGFGSRGDVVTCSWGTRHQTTTSRAPNSSTSRARRLLGLGRRPPGHRTSRSARSACSSSSPCTTGRSRAPRSRPRCGRTPRPSTPAVSLRSALARLDGLGREAIVAESSALSLTDIVHVDYVEAQALAHRLLDSDTPIFDGDLASAAIATLSRELLPDWFDGWIIAESEEWRHLRASAGEALAYRLLCRGTFRRSRKRRPRRHPGRPAAGDAVQHARPHPPGRRQPVGRPAGVRDVPRSPARRPRPRADRAPLGIGLGPQH